MAAKIEIFEENKLYGLILNGKVLLQASFYKIHKYADYFTAIGKPGYYMIEVEKDKSGNEVAIIKKKIED